MLIGLSGCGGIFTEEVLTEVGNGSPVIINYIIDWFLKNSKY